jgi:anti-anti-sigma factor
MDGFHISRLDGERGLRLIGELDMQSAPVLRDAFAGLSGDGQTKLDLSDLTFMDSSGMHVIVDYARTQNGKGPLILEGVSPMLMRLLEITDLAQQRCLDIRVRTNVD